MYSNIPFYPLVAGEELFEEEHPQMPRTIVRSDAAEHFLEGRHQPSPVSQVHDDSDSQKCNLCKL